MEKLKGWTIQSTINNSAYYVYGEQDDAVRNSEGQVDTINDSEELVDAVSDLKRYPSSDQNLATNTT